MKKQLRKKKTTIGKTKKCQPRLTENRRIALKMSFLETDY